MMPVAKRRVEPGSETMNNKSEIPLGKYLASTEKKIRDGAIKSLANFLAQSDREPLSDVEMAKLWKGIFYCFWMSDKPRVQQALAQELSDLLLIIKTPSSSTSSPTKPALLFLEGFFDAMVREWPGLDKWRVDKFYLLFRRFVNAAFRLLARHRWEEEGLSQFTQMLTKQGGPLCPNDIKVPDGIAYHLADVYVEELNKAVSASDDEDDSNSSHTVPLLKLLQPFITTMATCYSSLVYDRISNEVIKPVLEDCLALQVEEQSRNEKKRKATSTRGPAKRRKGNAVSSNEEDSKDEDDDDDDDDESRCNFADLMQLMGKSGEEMRRAIFEAMFQSASQSDSLDARRRRLYKMCKEEEERLEEEGDL